MLPFLENNVTGLYDWIVSFCALQHCTDQPEAIKRLYPLLKENGKVLVMVPTRNNPSWNQARASVQQSEKWRKYWNDFSPRKFLNEDEYRKAFEDAGFSHIKVTCKQTLDPFVNREEMISWLQGTFAPMVPEWESHAFYNDWVDEYIRLDPTACDADGVIYCKFGLTLIEAHK